MSNNVCSRCGRTFKNDECSFVFVDPKSEWWRTINDLPQYCNECANAIRPVPPAPQSKVTIPSSHVGVWYNENT
jgi:hypothetical protein